MERVRMDVASSLPSVPKMTCLEACLALHKQAVFMEHPLSSIVC